LDFGVIAARKLSAVSLELVLRERLDSDRNAPAKGGNRRVRNVARLRNENLVAGLDQRPQGEIDPFAAADRDDHFLGRVVTHVKPVV